MCYLVREQQAGAAERGGATLPPSLDRLRARWVAGVAAALMGGLAVAALVAPASTSPLSETKDAAPAPVAIKAVTVPAAAAIERGSLVADDDGVPTAPETVKAGMGHCDHAL